MEKCLFYVIKLFLNRKMKTSGYLVKSFTLKVVVMKTKRGNQREAAKGVQGVIIVVLGQKYIGIVLEANLLFHQQ